MFGCWGVDEMVLWLWVLKLGYLGFTFIEKEGGALLLSFCSIVRIG